MTCLNYQTAASPDSFASPQATELLPHWPTAWRHKTVAMVTEPRRLCRRLRVWIRGCLSSVWRRNICHKKNGFSNPSFRREWPIDGLDFHPAHAQQPLTFRLKNGLSVGKNFRWKTVYYEMGRSCSLQVLCVSGDNTQLVCRLTEGSFGFAYPRAQIVPH